MKKMSKFRKPHFLVLLFCVNFVSTANNVCKSDTYYIIRNRHSGLVLDGSDSIVLVQHYNANPAQFWSFQCASRPGLFNIANKGTGELLDFVEVVPQKCITKERDNSRYQEWVLNHDGGIVSAVTNMRLEIYVSNFTEGNFVRLYQDNLSPAQKFVLQEKRLLPD